MAVVNYHSANGSYPPAFLADAQGRPMHSWRVLLLPYLGQEDLFHDYDFSEPWDGPNNSKLAARMPKLYAFPGERGPTTNYLAVVGPGTVWPGRSTVTEKDVTDGLSNTILLVENHGAGIHWMAPRDLSFADMDFTINSPQGLSSKYVDPAVAMLDGSIRRFETHLAP
ncbi:MAG TPA: DUF1559 domain-containing protein, partial [Gemmataceae bacterium]|nr:DUF1559 domain-containing protein [Gemmataceae bacterium]